MTIRHRVNNLYIKARLVVPYLVFLLIIVTSCGLPTVPTGTQQSKDSCAMPTGSNKQPEVVYLAVDTLPIYPLAYYHDALSTFADRVVDHVTIDSSPLTVEVSYITSNSINRGAFSFTVPGVPALPAKPVLQTSTNAYQAAKLRNLYKAALSCWSRQTATLQQEVTHLQASVKVETDKLRNLPDVNDPVADDIDGAVFTASESLRNLRGVKYLFLASGLQANTNVNAASTINLSGVNVRVIWFDCRPASLCVSTQTQWTNTFHRYGASSVLFYPPLVPASFQVQF